MSRFRAAKSVLKMMAKDLKDRSKVDELTVTVVEKGEPRDWKSNWSGAGGRVCDAVGEDETGDKVNLTLWNDDVDRVQVNSKIKITNGWVSSYKNKLQVSAGKYGKLEVL
jgi:ssDNA-binding replication factor A large subunit